jgi:hypothetical protein
VTFIEHWPAELYPLVPDPDADPGGGTVPLVPDIEHVVEGHQLRPDLLQEFVEWSGGMVIGVINGGPVVLLPGTRPAGQRIAGLGDFAVRGEDEQYPRAELASGFWQRYTPASS